MTNIEVKEITYGEYGKCVQVSNGKVEIVATLDVGPRIIRYGFPGKANMFCNNLEPVYEKTGWKIMGGHRLWIAPEHDILSYEPDNSPIEYKRVPGGIVLIGNPEKSTGVTKEIVVALEEEGTNVAIKHMVTNNNLWPVEFAAWSISVMAPGGLEVVPVNKQDTGLLGNCSMSLWPYTSLNDKRVDWGNKYITLQQDKDCEYPFKFGITNPLGWAAYFNNGMMFTKKFQYIDSDGTVYPDNGMNYETYTCDFMTEMESLSPIYRAECGESVTHLELWTLVDDVEAPGENSDEQIDALFEKVMPDCVNNSAEDTGCCCGGDCGCDDDCDCDDDDCGCGDDGCCC
jgi:hypothetical protein